MDIDLDIWVPATIHLIAIIVAAVLIFKQIRQLRTQMFYSNWIDLEKELNDSTKLAWGIPDDNIIQSPLGEIKVDLRLLSYLIRIFDTYCAHRSQKLGRNPEQYEQGMLVNTVLQNEVCRNYWKYIIRDRFYNCGGFTKSIDSTIKIIEQAQSQPSEKKRGVAKKEKQSFVVLLWARIFGCFRCATIFNLSRHIWPLAVECWVLSFTALAFFSFVVCSFVSCKILSIVLCVLGAYRIYEIVVYLTNTVFFDRSRAEQTNEPYRVMNHLRLVLLSLHNYVEIVLWFAIFYSQSLLFCPYAFPKGLSSLPNPLYYSLATMTTLGCSNVNLSGCGEVLVSIQTILGVFMIVIIIARFVASLPTPEEQGSPSGNGGSKEKQKGKEGEEKNREGRNKGPVEKVGRKKDGSKKKKGAG
ncbi:MAG: hypothetical protein K8R46_14715 [Pirellulales bacterium]|nr:hypothetical protein [Pirellulales bacterium]